MKLLLKACGVVGAVIAFFAVWWRLSDDLPNEVCPWGATQPHRIEAVVQRLPKCSGDREPITDARASRAIDAFLATAGGASPGRAYTLHTSDGYQEHHTSEDFVATWQPVLAAERTRHLVRGDGFNRYVVKYLDYYAGDGTTDQSDADRGYLVPTQMTVDLTEQGGQIRVAGIPDLRPDGDRQREVPYAGIEATTHTMGYVLPSHDAATTGATNILPGKVYRTLCTLELSTAGGDETWYRTRLGWVAAEDFEVREEPGIDRACSPLDVERLTDLAPGGDD